MAFIIGVIMVVVAASLVIYMVSAIVGVKEGLIIIAISIFITIWVVISGFLISTGV